ncbi:LicD family protein [Parendozoicomonas haliclonae]|uniref:LicD family protein n=2 Tax=Parendozoicomonas haliclonae TaxID=1960125 RepID=A0A1X7AHU2_9GAMM|nr:LicD family protein [Parendozoicomonas haliclonae]
MTLLLAGAMFSCSMAQAAVGVPGIRFLPKPVFFMLAKSMMPHSYFRHARWAEDVTRQPHNLPVNNQELSTEDFLKLYKPIPHERAVDIYFMVMALTSIFEELDIKALPVGGTMLGMLRNKGQLPHDDDADFAVKLDDYDTLLQHPELFAQYGLKLRRIPGLGMQLCFADDQEWPAMTVTLARNTMAGALNKLKIPVAKKPLTKKAFIDITPVQLDEEADAYRYYGDYASEIWYQQTIPRELIEGEYSYYSFGPTRIRAPKDKHALLANMESVYPHSMTHIMRTPDHSLHQNVKAELRPLTTGQKQPFPLTRDDFTSLKQKVSDAGLLSKVVLKRPVFAELETATSANLRRSERVRSQKVERSAQRQDSIQDAAHLNRQSGAMGKSASSLGYGTK